MIRSLLIILLTMMFGEVFSQKEDYVWMTGQDTLNKIMFSDNGGYSIETRFNQPYWIDFTNISMSDENGELLFYSNGRAVYDKDDSLIENGDSLNYGYIWDFWTPLGGVRALQSIIALGDLSDENRYHLFHVNADFEGVLTGVHENILHTVIVNETQELIVTQKNSILVMDTMAQGGLTACRHGNGRDWWIFGKETNSNCYYYSLFTPEGVGLFQKQCLGKVNAFSQEIGFMIFSPDGSLFLRGGGGQGSNTDTLAGVEIFNFDRCTGLLSNQRRIPHIELADTSISQHYWGQISVSPNSRFLYVSNSTSIMQFDLQASNIIATKYLIYERDTTPPFTEVFSFHQLAPNGKIYISGSVFKNWHIIHNPNEQGAACNFENSVPLPHQGSLALPNFPNYRLGALIGSPCDTLGDTIDVVNQQEIERNLNVYPNPANQVVRIEYGNFLWSSTNHLQLQITNLLGQEVFFTELPQYSLYKDLNTQELGSGNYFVNIYQGNEVVGVRRLVVENE